MIVLTSNPPFDPAHSPTIVSRSTSDSLLPKLRSNTFSDASYPGPWTSRNFQRMPFGPSIENLFNPSSPRIMFDFSILSVAGSNLRDDRSIHLLTLPTGQNPLSPPVTLGPTDPVFWEGSLVALADGHHRPSSRNSGRSHIIQTLQISEPNHRTPSDKPQPLAPRPSVCIATDRDPSAVHRAEPRPRELPIPAPPNISTAEGGHCPVSALACYSLELAGTSTQHGIAVLPGVAEMSRRSCPHADRADHNPPECRCMINC